MIMALPDWQNEQIGSTTITITALPDWWIRILTGLRKNTNTNDFETDFVVTWPNANAKHKHENGIRLFSCPDVDLEHEHKSSAAALSSSGGGGAP